MNDLPFPKSLPGFQKLFPDDAACAALLGIASDAEPPTYESLYSGEYQHPWALTG